MPPVVAAVAVYAASGSAVWGTIATAYGIAGTALAGAVVGAVAGGATSALMGDDIGKGALSGALTGATTGGIISATKGAGFLSGEGMNAAKAGGSASTGVSATKQGGIIGVMKDVGGNAAANITTPAQQLQAGIDPQAGLQGILTANAESAASAAKWNAIGNAATEGAKGLLNDPEEDSKRELENALALQKAGKIKLSKDFADNLKTPPTKAVTPFTERLARIKDRYSRVSV